METQNILFKSTGYFSNLILDYISSNNKVKEFYQYPISADAIPTIIADKQQEKIDRNLLVTTIKNQYASIAISDSVSHNINQLKEENTFCVVTAHQLNIFGGPLYYIYKIAQTIATCNQLKAKYPSYHFVPVYWLGSEDHDFEEINHINLYQKKIEWQDKQGGCTGNYSTESILPLIDELKTIIGKESFSETLIQLFTNAYQQNNLTKATGYLVNCLFEKHGLVIVDGNDKNFKNEFSAVITEELVQQPTIHLVQQQLAKLEALGYKQQAFPREINLFYIQERSRERITFNSEKQLYEVVNTNIVFTKDEILLEVQTNPERFSPNVILRPLMQQKILPSVAYIGGAGELSYWLQLKTVFEHYKVNFPQLLLRNSALLVNNAINKKIAKVGFTTQDFFQDTTLLKKNYITTNTEDNIHLDNYKQEIEKVFTALKDLTNKIDTTLVNTVGAEQQKSLQSIDVIQSKLLKSLKQKNEVALQQIDKIKEQLFPNNSLQERVENFSIYYAKYGNTFIENLIENFNVYELEFLLFDLE